jgi:hypothetical protein
MRDPPQSFGGHVPVICKNNIRNPYECVGREYYKSCQLINVNELIHVASQHFYTKTSSHDGIKSFTAVLTCNLLIPLALYWQRTSSSIIM